MVFMLLSILTACTQADKTNTEQNGNEDIQVDDTNNDQNDNEDMTVGSVSLEKLEDFGTVESSVWTVDSQYGDRIYLSNVPDLDLRLVTFNDAVMAMFAIYEADPNTACADFVDIAAAIADSSADLYYPGANYMVFDLKTALSGSSYDINDNTGIVAELQFYTGNPWDMYNDWDPAGTMAEQCGLPSGAQPSTMDFYDFSSGQLEITGRSEGEVTGTFQGHSPETGAGTATFTAIEVEFTY